MADTSTVLSTGLPSFLQNQDLRFIFFGGKGGVGKTTSATASALYLARQRPDKKVLIVSTDPAHSVGDSFAQDIGDEVVSVKGVDNPSTGLTCACLSWRPGQGGTGAGRAGLWARELDAEKVLAEYRRLNNHIVAEIANRGTLFDEEDIADFMQLTLPGMDEVMAIRQIIELIKSGEYDLVVVDTAPAGHTVRMLQLPSQMRNWVKTLDMMMDKHRYMVRTFSGRYIPDECDHFLEEQKQDVTLVVQTLQNTKATEFVLVTIPEEMAIYESERLFATLRKERIPVHNLIVNHVIGGDGLCAPCQRKKAEQAERLAEIEERFAADLRLWPVPRLPHEVRGVEGLSEFVQLITAATEKDKETKRQGDKQPSPPHPLTPSPPLPLSLPSARFILVGGKGGVGKTSVAAATAIRLAWQFPDKKVLLFSTNPAHSVSDSLDQKVGAEITRIEGFDNPSTGSGHRLYAQEIDAAPKLLDQFIAEQREAIDEVFDGFMGGGGGNVRVAFEREIMDQLLTTTPPGLDELMSLMEIMKLVDAEAFDIFVLDSAATGHLIRFLELPHLAREWFATSAKLLLKYRGVVKLGTTAELTIKYSRQTRRVLQQLTNAAETEFIVVTIPEAMGIAEGERLIQGLGRLEIPCRQILINFVTLPSDCSFCAAKREEEQRYIQQVIAGHPDHRVAQAPRLDHDLRGMNDLVEFGKILYQ
ncbi:MAG: ArsA family ATPase [Anaerolineae bacterium]|nr:ArsA family ATPase [Anaerolineae bacterium]